MDFTLDKKHEMARNLFRDFAEAEVKPLAMEIDEEHRFPSETVEKILGDNTIGYFVEEFGESLRTSPSKFSSCIRAPYSLSGSMIMISSSGYLNLTSAISSFTNIDLPEPDGPRTKPFELFSFVRSRIIAEFVTLLMP